MPVKVGINGFGRIGRLVFRAAAYRTDDDIQVVGVNDLVPADNLAYLLKHDSTHGMLRGKVSSTDTSFTMDGREIRCFSEKDPSKLPWGELGADIVVESTGLFTNYEGASQHLKGGAKKVIISAPTKDPEKVPTICLGVNEEVYDPKAEIVSCASCTTNCLAPVTKVILDNFGLDEGETDRHVLPRADGGRVGGGPDLPDEPVDELQGDLRGDESGVGGGDEGDPGVYGGGSGFQRLHHRPAFEHLRRRGGDRAQ